MQEFHWAPQRRKNTKKRIIKQCVNCISEDKIWWEITCNGTAIRYQCPYKLARKLRNSHWTLHTRRWSSPAWGLIKDHLGVPDAEGLLQLLAPLLDLQDTAAQIWAQRGIKKSSVINRTFDEVINVSFKCFIWLLRGVCYSFFYAKGCCTICDVKDLWSNCHLQDFKKQEKKNALPWNRSSDRLPPEPTAGSKTLLFAPLLGSQPHQSLSVKEMLILHFDWTLKFKMPFSGHLLYMPVLLTSQMTGLTLLGVDSWSAVN